MKALLLLAVGFMLGVSAIVLIAVEPELRAGRTWR